MNGTRLRVLLLGCILITLGVAVYFTIGGETRLVIFIVVGIVLLLVGAVYPNGKEGNTNKGKETASVQVPV